MTQLELIHTNLRRNTFQCPQIKEWAECNCSGRVLNLFAGPTKLEVQEVRNDINATAPADYHKDALDFVLEWGERHIEKFDTVLLDPPYSYRKAMEMYQGNYCSRFKRIADNIWNVLKPGGQVISFGYHSSFLGKIRGFELKKLCVFAHGGAQHCTIGIIEQ